MIGHRKTPAAIWLSPEQWEYLDQLAVNTKRGIIVGELLDEHRRRHEAIMRNAPEADEEEYELLIDSATVMDYEIVYNAHRNLFFEPLLHESQNGRDIDRLIAPFSGLVEKSLHKKSEYIKVRSFLLKKLEEVSTTD
jgi:hypothetical protein